MLSKQDIHHRKKAAHKVLVVCFTLRKHIDDKSSRQTEVDLPDETTSLIGLPVSCAIKPRTENTQKPPKRLVTALIDVIMRPFLYCKREISKQLAFFKW